MNLPAEKPSVQGYYVPKTLNYLTKAYSFPKAKRNPGKTSKSPGPTLYIDEYKENFKKHWDRKVKFKKANKLTIIDDTIKSARLTPGPGQYSFENNKKNKKKMYTTFGYFLVRLSERVGFVDQAEYSAGETPASWNYSPIDNFKKKGMAWAKPKAQKRKKELLGPGKYADGVEKALTLTRPVSPATVFSRSYTSSPLEANAKISKAVPPVGSYKNLEKTYQKLNFKNDRSPIILPYKSKGAFDDCVKRSKQTPGPGSYNIGPPSKTR
jgi:hypothetical protein